jgi:diguanylate cyclase (GGDEF)-like protein
MRIPDTGSPRSGRRLRVLLAGGNARHAEEVQRLLGASVSTRFELSRAERTADVAEHPAAKSADVLLLDVGRATDRGAAALSALRAELPAVPAVMLADDAGEAVAAEMLQLGASAYLVRGELTTRQLVLALRSACGAAAASGAAELRDPLTGLATRWLFRDRLEQALASAARTRHGLAVLHIALDALESIRGGLDADLVRAVVCGVGERLHSAVRESDTVARVGEGEFAVLATHLGREADAASVAAKIVDLMGRPLPLGGRSFVSSASVGIAAHPHDGADASQLLERAESALYRARARGGARFEFHSPELNAAVERRVVVEARLGEAIASGDLLLYYQPQYDLRRNRIVGAEALVRWRHPELGLLSPAEFLPIAQDRGWMDALGTWVLREACRRAAGWQAEGHAGLRISVNVAPSQLRNPAFPELVRGALDQSGLRAESLELEITEGAIVAQTHETAESFRALRALGVRLAIDDFGTGYSALEYLKRLPVDVIKIDQSFVRDLTDHPAHITITEAIVKLAQGLGLGTVAEGVETPEQVLALGACGCHRLQGFLFGRPAPPEVLGQWLDDPPFRWGEQAEKA